MAEAGRERRKFPRIATDQVISFAPVDYSNEQLAVSMNISAGGIRFEAVGCEMELGDTIRVTFNVGEHTVVAVCEVCWATELDKEERLAVSKNVSSGGIRFEAVGCEITQGDTLRVTFNVMKQTVVAIGTVVWATETDPISMEVGIEFMDIDPVALRLLEESVNPESDSDDRY